MFQVYKNPCKNCLFTKNRIVSEERAKQIIQDCVKNGTHFICHKASMEGKDICCKLFYDNFSKSCQLIRIAQRLNCVEFVEQEDLEKLPIYKE